MRVCAKREISPLRSLPPTFDWTRHLKVLSFFFSSPSSSFLPSFLFFPHRTDELFNHLFQLRLELCQAPVNFISLLFIVFFFFLSLSNIFILPFRHISDLLLLSPVDDPSGAPSGQTQWLTYPNACPSKKKAPPDIRLVCQPPTLFIKQPTSALPSCCGPLKPTEAAFE